MIFGCMGVEEREGGKGLIGLMKIAGASRLKVSVWTEQVRGVSEGKPEGEIVFSSFFF